MPIRFIWIKISIGELGRIPFGARIVAVVYEIYKTEKVKFDESGKFIWSGSMVMHLIFMML